MQMEVNYLISELHWKVYHWFVICEGLHYIVKVLLLELVQNTWGAVHNKKTQLGQKHYMKEYLSFGLAKSQLVIVLF